VHSQQDGGDSVWESVKNDAFVGERWYFSCGPSPWNARPSGKKRTAFLCVSSGEKGEKLF